VNVNENRWLERKTVGGIPGPYLDMSEECKLATDVGDESSLSRALFPDQTTGSKCRL